MWGQVSAVYGLGMGARWARPVAAATVVALVTAGLTGCGRQVSGPSLVLQLASGDKATDDTAPAILHFADEVDRRSGGTIRIDPVWRVAEGKRLSDQLTAGLVADGTYELGTVPGRAFDDLGVDSLRALSAPFLLTGGAALDAVLSSPIREELLAGLPRAGVVGLDILPDALRHPFGFVSPMVALADYHHALIVTPYSRTGSRLFHELGADVTEYPRPGPPRGGVESQFSRAPAGANYATGNVTFFPRTDVLVADQDVRNRLRDDQWAVLVAAAADTREWQGAQQPSDFEAAADFCARGGKIVAASDTEIAELAQGAAPVTGWLRQDPATRRLLDEIARIVRETPAESPITGCPGRVEDPSTSLDGVYRARVPIGTLLRAGATQIQAQENSGRWTWTLDRGTYTFHTRSSRYVNHPDGTGRFTYDGRTLVIVWDSGPEDFSTMTVRVADNGDLHFSAVRESLGDNQLLGEGLFSIPWRRVGDLPD
jgi:TRAP-type C4-dicarboxylate transport system substrate-binding protein